MSAAEREEFVLLSMEPDLFNLTLRIIVTFVTKLWIGCVGFRSFLAKIKVF